MTYFNFLILFLVIPIVLLTIVAAVDRSRGRRRPTALRGWSPWTAILLHVFIALIYTTAWDNYLVATRVWWYDPELVTGITLGWVPIEEYTFFILQPILAGLWLLFLARRLSQPLASARLQKGLRWSLTLALALVWLASIVILIADWQAGTYLALELIWALPPIALQLVFGADILWHFRRLVFLAIVPLTLYLSAADALAITMGTWTINPEQSLNIFIAGLLPVEELLFFLLTNTLISFGIVLLWAKLSHERFAGYWVRLGRRRSASPQE
jgi:lycopene cyclase domain-containing protein